MRIDGSSQPANGFTGFYLRVLSEGYIRAGDTIEPDFLNRDAPTVDDVHRLYYLDRKDLDALERAVACETLANAFRDDFETRLRKRRATTTPAANAGR